MRFGDIDRMGHVNNARQMEYLDIGKADYSHRVMMHSAQVENITPIVAAVKVDFLAQLLYRDDVLVRTWVERIGTKSITMRQQIVVRTASEKICTEAETVMVAYNRTTGQTVEFPQPWRERIERREG